MQTKLNQEGLDSQARSLLEQINATPNASSEDIPSSSEAIAAARFGYRATIPLAGSPEPVHFVYERQIPAPAGEIRVRIYRPTLNEGAPILVYFHGGGFVVGDLDTHDTPLRALANRAGCIIVSVDYRLAPEHPFPAAPEDCYAATKWVAEHAEEIGGDNTRIAVGGDSAGGDLAAVVCLLARDRGTPIIKHQVLLYPDTDLTLSSASWTAFAEIHKFVTTKGKKAAWVNMYIPKGMDVKHPYVSPLHAQELSKLPSALVITAEFDAQRDEGEAYAKRLKQAGVAVEAIRYEGMIHGFFQMAGVLDQGKRAIEQTAAALRKAFEN